MTPELIDGRFRVLRPLGEGASARVLLVDDLLRGGRRLALKQLAAETPRELLASEFEALSALSHPGLVALHDLELDGERPYLTVEYVEGPGLLAWARGRARAEVVGALTTLLEALALLHDRGWVHGDLKPENVLVDAVTDQPKLCDLGLARRGGGLRAGTAGYAAPELLLGGGTSPASDVYAFGVLCLEALAGRRAFGEDAAAAVERQARGESVLRELSEIPPPLSELLGRCLEREPSRRPSARELLLRLAELGEAGPARPRLLPEASLQGRARELETIERAIERAASGEPGAWLIAGEPGLGKTRLLQEARRLALRRGFASPLAGDLRQALASLRAAAGGLAALDPALAVSLAGLLPSLEPRAQALTSAGLETRLRAALLGLATAASARRPVLLLLDDVDRLEPVEQAALHGLCRFLSEEGAGRPRLLLLLAARQPAGALAELDRLALEPLELTESEALLRSMLPPTAEAPIEELARLAAGSPLLLAESLRAWLLRASATRLEGSADPLAALARERLAGLAGDARRGLRIVALAPELDARALDRLCPLEPAELTALLARRLLRERTGEGRVLLAIGGEHLRAILEGELEPDARRALHRAIAEALEALPAPPEDTAWHLERAGALRAAAERYLAAAEAGFDYRGRFASRAAELGGTDWSRLPEALRRAARSLADAGEAAQALRSLERLRAAGIANDADRRFAAELLILLGEPARALELLDPLPPGAGLLAAQACTLLDRRAEAGALCEGLPESGGRANLLGLLALSEGALDRAGLRFADAEARFLEERDLLGLAKAENNLAIVAQRRGDLGAARRCFARAIEHAREAGDPVRAIHGQINRGTVCQLAGELASAISDYQQAVLEAVRLGSPRLEAQARLNHATLRIELGDPAGAEQELSRIRDESGLGVFVHANRADLALLRQDLPLAEEELRAAEAACPASDPAATVELALLRARLLRARGEHGAAAALATRVSEEAARAGQGRLADEATLAACLALRRTPDASARELRLALEGVASRMEARGERARLWLVHHELALAEALSGRELESGFHLAKARAAAEALLEELPEPLRRTLLTRPEFREVYAATRPGSSGPAPERPGPSATLDAEDAEGLLRVGLELGRVRDPAELVARVLDKAIEITDAQRGLLILVEGDALRIAASRNLDPGSLADDAQFSTRLAHDVIGSGRAVVTVDASADDRFRHFASVSNLRLRSVLCVPLKIWGAIAGVIYLDNRFRPGVFSPRRIAVLESLGAQAGLALDTARLLEEERRRTAALAEAKREVEALSEELRRTVDRQSRELGEKEELVRAQERQLAGLAQFDEIVGRAPPIRRVLEQIAKTASAEIPIYIFGESGTGKELIARAIHRASPRRERPMITVNCGGLPPALLQSELFGHLRGAFTGAVRDHPGLFRMADRGTIFLDEVTEMSPDLQVQLLRVLQTGTFRPVGGEREVQVDVRVISASNLDLDEAVGRGGFREDLSYRLNVLRLDLPALRERREDIPLLVRHFLGERAIDREALLLLQHHDWPGNVRELANELARASALAEGPIRADDLSPKLTPGARLEALGAEGNLEQRMASFERELLREALAEEGSVGEIARRLGLSRAGLYKKLARHRLSTGKRS